MILENEMRKFTAKLSELVAPHICDRSSKDPVTNSVQTLKD